MLNQLVLPLLSLFLLLSPTFSQDIISIYAPGFYSISEDISCYKKTLNIKKLIFRQYGLYHSVLREQMQAALKGEFIQKADVIINAYAKKRPQDILSDFYTQIYPIPFDTVWLRIPTPDTDCSVLKTYVYYCKQIGLKCGISMSDWEWESYVVKGGDRTGCSELGEVPLFYRGGVKDWKQMGGWLRYNQIEIGEKVDGCYNEYVSVYRVDKR